MPCVQFAPGVIVTMASNQFLRKTIRRCPICECMTEMVDRHEARYGVSTYCCKCGDSWQDGELYPRPFARGWRTKAVRRHRTLWDEATHGPAPTVAELFPDLVEAS